MLILVVRLKKKVQHTKTRLLERRKDIYRCFFESAKDYTEWSK